MADSTKRDGADPAPENAGDSQSARADRRQAPRLWVFAGAIILVAAVAVSGRPGIDAGWIQGDEHIFIVNNPDVTGAGEPGDLWERSVRIFLHPHEDLYQPIPILTYAWQWALAASEQQAAQQVRIADVGLHAVNTLLVWTVLVAGLRLLQQRESRADLWLGWAVALLWALHPTLVAMYTADMGRTHLLSTMFLLLALLAQFRSLRNGVAWTLVTVLLVLLAMLCKPVVGWVLIAFALEATVRGWRYALRSARVWMIGVLCVVFAGLTLQTTQQAGMLNDAELALFGDPLSRSLLAVWLYLRNIIAPVALATWHLPDIRTGWTYWPVWAGLALTLLSILFAAAAWRRPALRGVTVGIIWFWATLLPVIGIVGARVSAAVDRYLYLPLLGLLIAVAVTLRPWATSGGRGRRAVVLVVAVLAGAAMLRFNVGFAALTRSTIARAERVAALNPGDPRAAEMVAAAYDFARDGATPAEQPEIVAAMRTALDQAAELREGGERFFRNEQDLARFHRRLSWAYLRIGAFAESLAQAERAREHDPDGPMTWTRLAQAHRALGNWAAAREAYERLFEVLPTDAPDRGLRLTEYADLLLHRFGDAPAAMNVFRDALAEQNLTPQAQLVAKVGLGRAEILAGEGVRGAELVSEVLLQDPDNRPAWTALALYHLRSHHWEKAAATYGQILQWDPTHYEALRGYQEVCAQLGDWESAAEAWAAAVARAPENLIFNSFLVFAAACADLPDAAEWAAGLRELDPDNRFAEFATAILALRNGDLHEALAAVRRAARGNALPEAREVARTLAALRQMQSRGALGPEAQLVRAGIWRLFGNPDRGRELAEAYLAAPGDQNWTELAQKLAAPGTAFEP